MTQEGFKVVKRKVIAALLARTYQHETNRSEIDTKNLLFTGDVSPEEICQVLKESQGQDHSSSPHHHAPSIIVHIIRRNGWYLKFYFVDPDTIFISAHK